MRRVVVCNFMSLDGRFSGPEGNVMALPWDAGFDDYLAERYSTAGTMVLGRTSFEGLVGYWPGLADDEGAPPIEREVSRYQNAIEKVVVSDSLTPDATGVWADTTRIVPRADAHREVAAMREQEEEKRDILVPASHVLWNDLLAAGLVDEIHLVVGPGVAGPGEPAFRAEGPARFGLLDARRLPGGDLVVLQYAVRS